MLSSPGCWALFTLQSQSGVPGGWQYGITTVLTSPRRPKPRGLHAASAYSLGVVFFFWGPGALFLRLIHPLWGLQFCWHRCWVWLLLRSLFWSWGDTRSWWCGAHGSHFPQTPAGAALLRANVMEESPRALECFKNKALPSLEPLSEYG